MATDAALVANDREPLVIATKLVGAAVVAGGAVYAVSHGGSLTSIALWACAGFALSALLSLWIKLAEFEPHPARRAGEIALALAPTLWAAGALWLVQRLLAALSLSLSSLGGAAVAVLLFLALSAPCLLYAHRRTGVGREVLAIARRIRRGEHR